jgi:orotate phosphoribosyltransferase
MTEAEKRAFIQFMLDAEVLRFGSFTTKSGRQSPYFINTGNYRTGGQIAALGKFYAALIRGLCGDDFTALFGPAYKGIPLVTAAAAALAQEYGIDKPYFFNRKEVKDHGEGGSIIGYHPQNGDRIILVEDVITAGTAIREVMPLLAAFGRVRVTDMFISVDRCEYGSTPGQTAVMEVAREFGVKVHALVTVADIRAWLADSGGDPADIGRMDAYMKQYCVWE